MSAWLRRVRGSALIGLMSLAAMAFSREPTESIPMDTTLTPLHPQGLVPAGHVERLQRQVLVDGEPALLTRYERADGRNPGLGGEHFSTVVDRQGRLKGFAHLTLDLQGRPLPSRARAEEVARAFLRTAAPDLLRSMQVSWIEPHDESVQVHADGRSATHTVTGMKVKCRNMADGRWFWVIVGADEKPLVFERDIVWITFPGHRQTEKWLHDAWLAQAG